MRSVLSTALVATFLATVATAEPQRFRVVDIGSLVGLSTFPTALNESGDVVGYSQMGTAGPHSEPPTNAFLYSNGSFLKRQHLPFRFRAQEAVFGVEAITEGISSEELERLRSLGYVQ